MHNNCDIHILVFFFLFFLHCNRISKILRLRFVALGLGYKNTEGSEKSRDSVKYWKSKITVSCDTNPALAVMSRYGERMKWRYYRYFTENGQHSKHSILLLYYISPQCLHCSTMQCNLYRHHTVEAQAYNSQLSWSQYACLSSAETKEVSNHRGTEWGRRGQGESFKGVKEWV